MNLRKALSVVLLTLLLVSFFPFGEIIPVSVALPMSTGQVIQNVDSCISQVNVIASQLNITYIYFSQNDEELLDTIIETLLTIKAEFSALAASLGSLSSAIDSLFVDSEIPTDLTSALDSSQSLVTTCYLLTNETITITLQGTVMGNKFQQLIDNTILLKDKLETIKQLLLQNSYTLTVNSEKGEPSPTVGSHDFASGSSITANVTLTINEGSNVWKCNGWTGTGSVPSSGSSNSVTFILTENSSITWNWTLPQTSETIYIREDGSIDPPTAQIKREGNLYTIEENIHTLSWGGCLIVQRSNIEIDGQGCTLEGRGVYTGEVYLQRGIKLESVNNVTISNLKITNFDYAVDVSLSNNNHFYNTNITNNGYGISFYSSNNNTLSHNQVIYTVHDSISLDDSSNNIFSENNITNNEDAVTLDPDSNSNIFQNDNISNNEYAVWLSGLNNIVDGCNITDNDFGIIIRQGIGNVISSNNISSNTGNLAHYGFGVHISWYSEHNEVIQNTIMDNGYGIRIEDDGAHLPNSLYNVISENLVTNNLYSINIDYSRHTIVSTNSIFSNTYGIRVYSASNTTISNNNIVNNDGIGVFLDHYCQQCIISRNNIRNNIGGIYLTDNSGQNFIFQNDFADNDVQAYVSDSVNVWDEGYPSGGNYWSDYEGLDNNEDGIGDTPYIINENNEDRYPLMDTHKSSNETPVLLVHGFQLGPFDPVEIIWKDLAEFLSGNTINETQVLGSFWKLEAENDDYRTVYISNYANRVWPTTADIRRYSKALSFEIEIIRAIEGVNEIDIVAHSMGGLVSRTYIENSDFLLNIFSSPYNNDVRKLIMIGTPNHGGIFPNLFGDLGIPIPLPPQNSILQMFPLSLFLQSLNGGDTGTILDVEYYTIAGNRYPWPLPRGDKLVAVDSVELDEVPDYREAVFPFDHTQLIHHELTFDRVVSFLSGVESNVGDFEFAGLCSYAELRVYDSSGRVTGLIDSEIQEEIPNSSYTDESVIIYSPSDSYSYELVGNGTGAYNLTLISNVAGVNRIFDASNISITVNEIHQYTVDWQVLLQGGEGVTVQIDLDGDGVFEEFINSDAELTYNEFEEEREIIPESYSLIMLLIFAIVITFVTINRKKFS